MTIYRRNWTRVQITSWAASDSYVHVRHVDSPGERGSMTNAVVDIMNKRDEDELSDSDRRAALRRVFAIGKFAQLIQTRGQGDNYLMSDETNCHEFVEMIGDIFTTTPKRVAELRGQLEDLCNDEDRLPNLGDDEVAFLGWMCTSIWSEQASEVDNPFDEVQTIRYPMIDVLEQYCPSKQSGEWPCAEMQRRRPSRTRDDSGAVVCVNEDCPAQPTARDGESVNDERTYLN